MEKADQGGKGVMVLATVKGDVHDIGKNLVDIILTNNGYTVKNLGIKVGITEMIAALEDSEADAIGMSGLLVKSTLIMRDNLEELNRRGLAHVPVILGGAALTRTYVERDLRQIYEGRLFYGKDAFEGLRTMDRLVELSTERRGRPGVRDHPRRARPRAPQERAPTSGGRGGARTRGATARRARRRWRPTTRCSSRRSSGAGWPGASALDDIAAYLNETALFRNQWGLADLGATWLHMSLPPSDVSVVVPDPVSPQIIFASGGTGIFKSTDGGQSWTTVYRSPASALVVDPGNHLRLAAMVNGTLLRSVDGGVSWAAAPASCPIAAGCGGALLADPTGSGTLIVGSFGLSISRDWGTTLREIQTGIPGSPSIAAFDPSNPGWIYVDTTARLHWQPLSV